MDIRPFSIQTLKRLPYYLSYLEERTEENVSSAEIAGALGLNEVQVRKDLASVSRTAGTPRRGFPRDSLTRDIRATLGYEQMDEAVICGVGHLGTALVNYQGFIQYGLRIVAGFDSKISEKTWVGKTPIFPPQHMKSTIRRMNIRLGIIAVNADNAQQVCDEFVSAGIKAIWNFSPIMLSVPDDVIVQSENLAASLAVLIRHLKYNIGPSDKR